MAKHAVPWVSPVSCPECVLNAVISIRIEQEETGGDGSSFPIRTRASDDHERQVCEAEGCGGVGGGGGCLLSVTVFAGPSPQKMKQVAYVSSSTWVSCVDSELLCFHIRVAENLEHATRWRRGSHKNKNKNVSEAFVSSV